MIQEGLCGFVFSSGGRVAGMSGTNGDTGDLAAFFGGHRFRVLRVHEGHGGTPDWADVEVAGKPVRLNPDLSLFRLYDCLWFAVKDWDKYLARPNPEVAVRKFGPGGRERFVFTYMADMQVLHVDTVERFEAGHPGAKV